MFLRFYNPFCFIDIQSNVKLIVHIHEYLANLMCDLIFQYASPRFTRPLMQIDFSADLLLGIFVFAESQVRKQDAKADLGLLQHPRWIAF